MTPSIKSKDARRYYHGARWTAEQVKIFRPLSPDHADQFLRLACLRIAERILNVGSVILSPRPTASEIAVAAEILHQFVTNQGSAK